MVRKIDIYVPKEARNYLLNHSTLSHDTVKGQPKFTVYLRDRKGVITPYVLTIPDLSEFASICIFRSREDEKSFGFLMTSIRTIQQEAETCWRWRAL